MNSRYEISTTPHANGDIEQRLEFVGDELRETIHRKIIHTQEQQIRDALIALGWTPPPAPARTVEHHPV